MFQKLVDHHRRAATKAPAEDLAFIVADRLASRSDSELCKTGQLDQAQPCNVSGNVITVPCCAYCDQPATRSIPANPEHVCFDHALEFWTGLMAFVKERADQCEKEVRPCTCRACVSLGASHQRARAITAAGPPPQDTDDVQVRRAS
jgi:hypothetical protein